MHQSAPHTSFEPLAHNNNNDYFNPPRSTLSWGAIFAGTVAALALHVLFMMLGTGLGLSIFSPLTEENPVADLSIGALIVHSICAIIALCLGGWVAGRFSPVAARTTGWLHGFSVWGAATVGGVIMVAFGASWMAAGASKMIGGGLSAVGQPAAELASEAVNQSEKTISSFVDEAVNNLPEDGPESDNIRATREVTMALGRLFNPAQESNTIANREAAVTALVDHTEMSQEEANTAVTEWTASFDTMQADLAALKETAETKAREAADAAADVLAKLSWWAFIGFFIGALGATGGGYYGAKRATNCEGSVFSNTHIPTGTPRRVAVKVPASRL